MTLAVTGAWLSQVGSRQNYVTPDDCRQSPILSAFDLSSLVPSGDETTQDAALLELIRGASSKVDDYVVGQFGCMAATQNTENTRLTVQPDGSLIVTPQFGPLIGIVSLVTGNTPETEVAIALTPTNTQVQRFRAIVSPYQTIQETLEGPLDFVLGLTWARPGRSIYATIVYVNGWPHTYATAQVAASSTNLPTLEQVLGWVPGAQGMIYDGVLTEPFQIAPAWNGTTLPVPLAGALKYAHGPGVIVSSLPETIRKATMHFIADMLDERGQEGFTIADNGIEAAHSMAGGHDHAGEAYDVLDAFRQAWAVPT